MSYIYMICRPFFSSGSRVAFFLLFFSLVNRSFVVMYDVYLLFSFVMYVWLSFFFFSRDVVLLYDYFIASSLFFLF